MCPLMHHVSCRVFGKTSSHPGDSAPLQPRFGTLWLLAFPKTKITFEREKTSDHRWGSRKYDRAADGYWENCVRSQGPYFERDWGFFVQCTMFLVSCIFNKCLYFSYYMAGDLLDRPHIFMFESSQPNFPSWQLVIPLGKNRKNLTHRIILWRILCRSICAI